jgi:hypothetical protein
MKADHFILTFLPQKISRSSRPKVISAYTEVWIAKKPTVICFESKESRRL